MSASTTTRSGVFQRLAQPGPRLGHRWELLWTDVIGVAKLPAPPESPGENSLRQRLTAAA
jgi:hypothetical protein